MKKLSLVLSMCIAAGAAGSMAQTPAANAPQGVPAPESMRDAGANWPLPLGSQGATRYSTLTQIDTSNVTRLKRAWTFRTGSGRFSGAPMVIDGVMYFSANNGVFALDATTGTQIWKYAPDASMVRPPRPERAPARFGGTGEDGGDRGPGDAGTGLRGPTYWPGGNGVGPRLFSTTRAGIAALDPRTGELIRSFGQNGVLTGMTQDSPPVIYRNVIVTDGDFEPGKGKTVRGWDVVTGQPLWTWYAKPQPGDPNREATWLDGSAESDTSPDIWGTTTLDPERGLVFVPIESVSGPNDKPGNNLYSNSVVALDALTGQMRWHRQLVHHDNADIDIAAAPVLFDMVQNGRIVPVLAEYSKTSLLFILNRETGEPIFGIEERPVPERAPRPPQPGAPAVASPPAAPAWRSPTQPFPVKPEPLAPNSGPHGIPPMYPPTITPAMQALCDSLSNEERVMRGPWRAGGSYGWMGVTYHRDLDLLITHASTPPLANRCVPPPWMELVAVRASTGDVAWRAPLGQFDELTARGVPPTGTPSSGASIATAGNLVFIGGSLDGYFRAFDARNGRELWRDRLPQPAHGTPSTYLGHDGKQYVVVGANGGSYLDSTINDEVIAYTLE